MYPDEHAKKREKLRQSQLKKNSCYVPLGVIPFYPFTHSSAGCARTGSKQQKKEKKKKKKEKYMHVTKVLGPLTCFLVLFPPSF